MNKSWDNVGMKNIQALVIISLCTLCGHSKKNSKALKGRLAPRSNRKEQCSILFGQFSKSRIRFPTTTKSLVLVGQLQQEYRDKKIK